MPGSGYDNTNSGALFRNDKRENEKQPTHTGNMETKCPYCNKSTVWWLSGWVKKAKNSGQKFFSLALTQKEGGGAKSSPMTTGEPEDFGDDIPF